MWFGYSRVSRVAGREHLISPELQQARIQAFADIRGWSVEMLPPELDVSGGKVSRPVLDSAIARIESGEAEGVIVSQIDRLSRMQMASALGVIERIESAGGQVVAVAENVDPTTPEGRMARNMFLSLAAMQRERNAESIAQAKERAVRLGIWPTNTVPFGYVKGPDRRLVPGDTEPLVEMFRIRASGGSWRQVAAVTGMGPTSAAKIVRNRVYLGELKVGEWHNPTAHPPIVDRALWEAAQIEHPAPIQNKHGHWLLKSLVRCGGCQRTMSHSEMRYRCQRKTGCRMFSRVSAKGLDAFAVDVLMEWAGDAAARAVEKPKTAGLEDAVQAAEAELDAFQKATAAAGEVEMFAEGLRQRVEAVRVARAELAATYRGADLPPVELEGIWPDLSVDERRQILRGFLGVIWVWPEHVRLVARGYEPQGLSMPGRKGPEAVPLDDASLEGEVGVALTKDLNKRGRG
jgi:DNA invertase Pin-like site-specific DNA recombinase